MESQKFEIEGSSGPIIKVIGDMGEVTELKSETVENPRFKLVGEYNKSKHPNYKPSMVFRDMKWILAYDKQAAKYPKRFKPRVSYAG